MVELKPMKRYANLFETMVGAYWVQGGVTYEEVFNWVDVTFRPLLYAAEQDVRDEMKGKKNENTRWKTEGPLTIWMMRKVEVEGGPKRAARRARPVTRSMGGQTRAGQAAEGGSGEEKMMGIERGAKRSRYERTGPVLPPPLGYA